MNGQTKAWSRINQLYIDLEHLNETTEVSGIVLPVVRAVLDGARSELAGDPIATVLDSLVTEEMIETGQRYRRAWLE